MVRWPATLKVVGSPFHDSMLTEHDRSSLVEGLWWVWLGGTQNHFWFKHVVGLAHCWVLRRHLVGVFSVPLPGLGVLTLPAVVWGWWCLWDWVCGGVLSVA